MRIAIDARMYQESGIGRYIRNLIDQLQILDKKNEYYILLDKRFSGITFQNKKFNKVFTDFGWYGISEQIKLPKLLKKINPDLVHFPHFNVPVTYSGKFVVTIHDLIHQHFQMRRATMHDPITYKIKQLGYNTVFKNAVSKAQKIIVPSTFVKKILVDQWKIDEDKVAVTYEGVDEGILKLAGNISKTKIFSVMRKFNIKFPFIFYVGNAHPHKNVEGLIKAFLDIREKNPDMLLVLSGPDHYFWDRLKKENKNKGIIYTGFITDEELVSLYKNAFCFVMPSFEEGFGIPVLEAQACGCPVVASNAGSLPEIAGDGALLINPKKAEDIVRGVIDINKVKEKLIKKGFENIKRYSWKKLGLQTLEVYEKCVLR